MPGKINTSAFTWVPDDLLEDPDISWRAIAAYLALRYHCKTKEAAFPGQKRMADMLRLSPDLIQRGLNELREKGLLEVEKNPGRSNTYYLWPTRRSQRQGHRSQRQGVTADSGTNEKKQREESNSDPKRIDPLSGARKSIKNLFFAAHRTKLGGDPNWGVKENALLKSLVAQWDNGNEGELVDKFGRGIAAFFDGSVESVRKFVASASYEFVVFRSQASKLFAAAFRCPKCGGQDYEIFAGERECSRCD